MPMTYTDDIQADTIKQKMWLVLEAMRELACDGDEALDGHGRVVEAMAYSTGYEWTAPAWLSVYSSTGTGAPFQDKLIERAEKLQAESWAEQFPGRADLFACVSEENEHQDEAHEWIDAALHDESISLNLEIESRTCEVIVRANFASDYNTPVGGKYYERRFDHEDFLTLAGGELEALVREAIDTAYQSDT